MKQVLSILMLFVVVFLVIGNAYATSPDSVEIPNNDQTEGELSPMSGDMINIIIILLCISGTALIIFLLMTLSSKK